MDAFLESSNEAGDDGSMLDGNLMLGFTWYKMLYCFVVVVSIASLLGCATDHAGNSPLMRAAFYGDVPKVEALLKTGADVNAANNMGETALLLSAWGGTGKGNVSIARALISRGADVNARDMLGVTTLMAVSSFGNVEIALLVLDAGADVNAQDIYGYTALHIAALHGHTEVVRAVLTRGAKPNMTDPGGVTPLMLACDCQLSEGVCSGRAEIVRLLIANGADVNIKDTHGNTALRWVKAGTEAEKNEIKELLKNAGAKE